MTLSLFRRKTDPAAPPEGEAAGQAQAAAEGTAVASGASAGTAEPQNLDATDPLTAIAGEPRVTLLRDGPGGRVERVELPGPDGVPVSVFQRLTVDDPQRGAALRELLLRLPEEATGFRDLLADETAFAAAFDLPETDLARLLQADKPPYRALDVLKSLGGIADVLQETAASSRLVWKEPRAELIGLAARSGFSAAGYREITGVFGAWDQLEPGLSADEARSARALAALFIPALDALLERARIAGFHPAHLPLAQLLGRLEELAQSVESYTELATACADAQMVELQCYAATDTGRRREHNEDAYCVLQLEQRSMAGARFTLAAVADGMGGHASGEVASSLALDLLRSQLAGLLLAPRTRAVDPSQLAAQLAGVIPAIGRALSERAELDPQLAGMGTTLVGLAHLQALSTVETDRRGGAQSPPVPGEPAHGGRQGGPPTESFSIFWVGDSRAYLLSASGIAPLSVDHSYVQGLLAAGQISADEAFSHPQKNIVTRCLGGSGGDPRPEVVSFTPGPSELLLLCSDGLSDALRDEDIWSAVCAADTDDLNAIARALIDAANAAGGPDNITVVLVGTG